MARWHLQISCPPVWEHCRNVSICPLTSCKVRVGHSQGIFSPPHPPTHALAFIWKTSRTNPCAAPVQRLLLPAACSHMCRSYPSTRLLHCLIGDAARTAPEPWLLPRTRMAYGWHEKKNDAVIRKLSLRLPWDMARWCCLVGFINSGSLPERERRCVKLEAAWHVTDNDDYIPPHCVHVSGCYVARPHLCCTLWSGSIVRLFVFF